MLSGNSFHIHANHRAAGEADFDRQRIACDHLGGILLDHAEQDHGHHFIERLLHQDGSFHGGQPALDAVTFDGDLRAADIAFCGAGLPMAVMAGMPMNMKTKKAQHSRVNDSIRR